MTMKFSRRRLNFAEGGLEEWWERIKLLKTARPVSVTLLRTEMPVSLSRRHDKGKLPAPGTRDVPAGEFMHGS